MPEQMLGLGFGFVEVGTVTPRPQAGQSEAAPVPARRGPGGHQPHGLQQSRPAGRVRSAAAAARTSHGVIGVNIGANKDSDDRIADYVAGVRAMSPVARYLTINISSPNTPGLRQLQDEGALRRCCPRSTRRASGRPADLPESRARSRRRRAGPDRPRRDAISGRCDHRRQHDGVAAAAQVAPRERAGRPVGRAAEAAGAQGAARFPRGERRRDPADRRWRDCDRGRCVGAHPGRREPGPALYGDGL